MRGSITIAAVQPPCVSYDVGANALTHSSAVRSAGSRVVVFPELSLTGYELDADPVVVLDPRLTPLIEACAKTGSVALAGAPVPGRDGHAHIAMLAVDGHGVRVAYRKNYLGDIEAERFEPGDGPGVVEVDGWRFGLAVCKDTGVRRQALEVAALGIDAYLAGLVMDENEVAEHDERARRIAIEHGVWVVFASFAGSTGGGYERAAGCSSIWSPQGDEIARAGRR